MKLRPSVSNQWQSCEVRRRTKTCCFGELACFLVVFNGTTKVKMQSEQLDSLRPRRGFREPESASFGFGLLKTENAVVSSAQLVSFRMLLVSYVAFTFKKKKNIHTEKNSVSVKQTEYLKQEKWITQNVKVTYCLFCPSNATVGGNIKNVPHKQRKTPKERVEFISIHLM